MEVKMGMCGLVIAFISCILGLVDIGLWLTCYFQCTTGKDIAFNYFAAIWTGALAFASGFMISVLFCVKFKFLGSFIIFVTCALVPCEIFCACIYGYRAYESRDYPDLDVPLFIGMAACSALLFVVTIVWNCYYCCIATPQEDYEEELKEEIEEEEERQDAIRSMQERFTNNPIVDDAYRDGHAHIVPFAQTNTNRYPYTRQPQYAGQNRYPHEQAPRSGRGNRQADPRGGNRRVNRSGDHPHVILEDYPYPPAFSRERVPEQQGREFRLPRANLGQSRSDAGTNRGEVNRAYEPDAFGRPIDEGYDSRVFMFDGLQGQQYSQQAQSQYTGRTPPPGYYSDDSRRESYQYGTNSFLDAGRQRNDGRETRDVSRYGIDMAQPQQRDSDRSHIYRPRPDNYRGKPPKPAYMQQERSGRSNYGNGIMTAAESSQYSAFRGSQPSNAYF